MNTRRTSLYLPTEVEQAMKRLADEHDRSLNGEIIQACKAWIAAVERTRTMAYKVHYELGVGDKVIDDTMWVEAVSEERAIEFCGQTLDQEYNHGENENNVVLLTCEVMK